MMTKAVMTRLAHATLLGLALSCAAPAIWARDGVDVGERSSFSKLVSAEQVEKAAVQQYAQVQSEARTKGALLPDNHPQVLRLREIARRIIPHSYDWNPRAREWK